MILCITRHVSMKQEVSLQKEALKNIQPPANMDGLMTLIGSSPINGIMILCIMRRVSMIQESTSTRATLTHIKPLANMVGLRTLIGW